MPAAPTGTITRRIVRTERRRRGFFGWAFLVLFLAFNGYMVAVFIGFFDRPKAGDELVFAEGAALLVAWALGSVILGMLALVTRGRKTIVEEDERA